MMIFGRPAMPVAFAKILNLPYLLLVELLMQRIVLVRGVFIKPLKNRTHLQKMQLLWGHGIMVVGTGEMEVHWEMFVLDLKLLSIIRKNWNSNFLIFI